MRPLTTLPLSFFQIKMKDPTVCSLLANTAGMVDFKGCADKQRSAGAMTASVAMADYGEGRTIMNQNV